MQVFLVYIITNLKIVFMQAVLECSFPINQKTGIMLYDYQVIADDCAMGHSNVGT